MHKKEESEMATFKKYAIPVELKPGETVNNHFPLTRSEVTFLLEEAIKWKASKAPEAFRSVASIQGRLEQGVKGVVSPWQDDETLEKTTQIDKVFVDWIKEAPKAVDQDIVNKICKLLEI